MKVFITGGTGFIGSSLTEKLVEKGFHVTVLTRRDSTARLFPEGVRLAQGDPSQPGSWQEKLSECSAVINLAGASIFQRWNEKSKRIIRESRMATTRNIVTAMAQKKEQSIDLINASAVGFYGNSGEEPCEENHPPGSDFLALITREWETEALKAREYGSRVVLCRFGIVLGSQGGALSKMLPFFRWGMGARLGSGRQWFSWIHREDLSRIIQFVLQKQNIQGAVNCTAPHPVQNKDFTKALAKAVKKPLVVPPLPGFFLKIAWGELSEVLLKGQRVMPRVLMEQGFSFLFPDVESALHDLAKEHG